MAMRNREDDGMITKVVSINRVSKTVKGGRIMKFAALVVVGDGKGTIGYGIGKSGEVPEAIRKGEAAAKKNMHKVALKGTTIPHEIVGKYGAGAVLLKPAAPGTGMIAGGPVRAVIEAAGIKDVRAKSMRSNNPINVVAATFAGLCGLVSGLGTRYLMQNEPLRAEIRSHGALVTEFRPFTPAGKHTFPLRNRLISGMSEGLLVVEAGSHSGSLITARCALEQGRDVYAVPGSVLSTDFAGTNDLINDGAYVVTQPVQLLSGYAERYHLDLNRVPSVQQLLAAEQDPGANLPQTSKEYDFERLEEGRQRLKKRRENQALLTAAESAVLAALPEVFTPVDQVAAKAAMPQGQLLAALNKLELLDLAESAPGSRFRKK